MKRSLFLLICAIGSFCFGSLMFFIPAQAAVLLGIDSTPAITSLLHGMGGLIIGTGLMNYLFRNDDNYRTVRSLLLTNIITHLLGLTADLWGVFEGVLTLTKMAPVEITHLFVGIGSLLFLLRLKKPHLS